MKNGAAFVNMIQLIHVRVLSNASNLTGNQTVVYSTWYRSQRVYRIWYRDPTHHGFCCPRHNGHYSQNVEFR